MLQLNYVSMLFRETLDKQGLTDLNRITINNFASFFNCTPASQAYDLVQAPTYFQLMKTPT